MRALTRITHGRERNQNGISIWLMFGKPIFNCDNQKQKTVADKIDTFQTI